MQQNINNKDTPRYSVLYFKNNKIQKIDNLFSLITNKDLSNIISKNICDNHYDFAITTCFDKECIDIFESRTINEYNDFKQKYWVRFVYAKPCFPKPTRAFQIQDNQYIIFKRENIYIEGGSIYYRTEIIKEDHLFNNKQVAEEFYRSELQNYKNRKIQESILKYS